MGFYHHIESDAGNYSLKKGWIKVELLKVIFYGIAGDPCICKDIEKASVARAA